MSRQLQLTSDGIKRLYLTYLWPSVAGVMVTSFYVLVDTILIGRGLGRLGLAALDLSLPLYNLLTAVGYLLGIGGATAYSTSLGRRKAVLWHSIFCGALFSSLLFLAGRLYLPEIVLMLGASAESAPYLRDYVGVLLDFSPFLLFVPLLAPFINNDQAPQLTMWGFIIGGLTNLGLDFWFIFGLGWGMRGAALATGIAAVLNFGILCSHFFSPNCKLKPRPRRLLWKDILRIVLNGFPSFVPECASGISVFLLNRVLLELAGDLGVAAHGIIANMAIVCAAIFTGIGQALQPIVSVNYGAGKWRRVAKTRNLSVYIAALVGVILFALGQLFPARIVGVFIQNEPELLDLTVRGIQLFSWSFLPMGINTALIAYFQSMEFALHAISLALARGAAFVFLALLVLPREFGVDGVWLVIPAVEASALVLGVAIASYRKH